MQTFRPISESRGKNSIIWLLSSGLGLQPATLILLTTLGFFIAVIFSWLLGNSYTSELFAQLHIIQENPPIWLETPQLSNKYYLLAPTILIFLLAEIIIKVSPQPQKWSRRIVVSILLILIIRYLSWRVLSTLNLSNPIDGIFSLTLLLMELLAMAGSILQLLMMFNIKERDREADRYSRKVIEGKYTPSVDILIPTYNEPEFILKRTIIGCQALDYTNKKIYLLDDTRRPKVRKLARELGCNYITRPDNSHAKAGNLNHAIPQTSGELIVVFDADFIPTTNFLTRTVGFFDNKKVGLVQTPQSFYNSDPIARNLGLEDTLTPEEEVFYRHTQPMKDGAGSVVCAGTSFVVRRTALQEIGCFVTESLSEDYFTGISLSAKGYELVYLDEKLSAGLAAESISAHIDQRLRWVRGTLQAFFIKHNPLTISGLKIWQRLGHLEGLLHWFNCIPRLFFLLVPLAYTFFLIEPIKVHFSEVIYIFLPYYIVQLSVFSWLNLRSRSAILSDLYSLIQCFPLALTVIKVMLDPFSKGFKVTPKGLARDRFNYNWQLAFPLILLLLGSTVSFSISLVNPPPGQSLNLGLFWSVYNVVTISAALLTLLDIPKPSFYEWLSYSSKVQIIDDHRVLSGAIHKLSEEGMEILILKAVNLTKNITIELIKEQLTLQGYITRTHLQDRYLKLTVKFSDLSLAQHKRLIEILYCRPGQWQRKSTPGELKSVWILLQLLFRPLQFSATKSLLRNKLKIGLSTNS
ncbi:MAG: glycosyltransferase [Xenococcaceae cyanobacterium MO_188.B32]|nr:glycosyltransferase [Xenococcaceae cyanobacterium MO_188.B32]